MYLSGCGLGDGVGRTESAETGISTTHGLMFVTIKSMSCTNMPDSVWPTLEIFQATPT